MQTMSNNSMRMVPFVALEAACAAKDRTIGRLRRAVIALALALLVCVCALGACLRGAIDVRADAAAIAAGEAADAGEDAAASGAP